MSALPTVATEFLMMVLCILSAPVDQQVIRVDIIGRQGYSDTLIVQRSDQGFTVYDDMNGKLVTFATIQPQEGSKSVFVCTGPEGKKETVGLSDAAPGLNVSELRTESKVRLKTKNQVSIKVDRSGSVSFLKAQAIPRTYVVHSATEMDCAKVFVSEALSAVWQQRDPQAMARFFDKDAERKTNGKGSALASLRQEPQDTLHKITVAETIFFSQDDVEKLSKRFPDDMWKVDRVPGHLGNLLACLCVMEMKGSDRVGLWVMVVKKVEGEYKIVYIDDN